MATTHHMSVIANSCIKPPVNPETGLSATINERSAAGLRNTWVLAEDAYEQDEGLLVQNTVMPGERVGSVGIFNQTDSMIADLTADLGHLSDDAFYGRLLELKNQHRETLKISEQLYTEKFGYHDHGNLHENGVARNGDLDGYQPNQNYQVNRDHSFTNQHDSMERFRASLDASLRDSVRDMSNSKPPTGRSRPQARPQSAAPWITQSSEFQFSHLGGRHAQTGQSMAVEEEYWKPISAASSEMDYTGHCHEDEVNLCEHNDSRHAARSHIEDMWDNFSVEEYAPPRSRPRSASLSRLSHTSSRTKTKVEEKPEVDAIDWRHRITIPKPFRMSLRDSAKEKSKSLIEYERKRDEELQREEEECQRKFKAKPVPAHVYMPLFDEKMEEVESRRKYIRENCKELLKSKEQPFNFMKREEERKKYRHKNCENNNKAKARSEIEKPPPTKFKARPFPAHIFDNSVVDQLQEEEEYRRIRVQMRAEELLHSATLPPSMAARGKGYTEGKSRQRMYAERAKKAGFTSEHKFKPRIKGTIPDFEEMHRKLQTEMSQRKGSQEATVCKPFKLQTGKVSAKRHKIYEDICNDEESIKENKWPFKSSGSRGLASLRSMSNSMDSLPTKMTASSELRARANRARLQNELDAQLEELEDERRRRLKEKKLKKYISERASVNDHSVDLQHTLKSKLKEYKDSERARKEEYRRTLNEINERIEKRPLLFERTVQKNAQQAAERKYKETLRRAGLDEDYIASKGSEATDADLQAMSDGEDEYYVSHCSSKPSSARSRSQSRSQSRRYSSDFDGSSDNDRTPLGSDVEENVLD